MLEQNQENLATGRAYLEGGGAFPERAALNLLGGRFLTDFYLMVARWVAWASDVVERWPEDVREAPYDTDATREAVRLAETIDAIFSAGSSPPGSSSVPSRSGAAGR